MPNCFSNLLSRRHRKKHNNKISDATHSTHNPQGLGDSVPNVSGSLEPIQGTPSADRLQSSGMHQNEANSTALHIGGAVLEQGLKTLEGFADFIPMAPGLGPALEIVCGCIKVYHVSIHSINVHEEHVGKLT